MIRALVLEDILKLMELDIDCDEAFIRIDPASIGCREEIARDLAVKPVYLGPFTL